MTTPTEQAFLTMAKMAGINITDHAALVAANPGRFVTNLKSGFSADMRAPGETYWRSWTGVTIAEAVSQFMVCADSTAFPIVASTFLKLVEERPELREHYDRAKEAWEASQ